MKTDIIKTSIDLSSVPNPSAVAAAEILHAFNPNAVITGAEVMKFAAGLDNQIVQYGVDCALGIITPAEMLHLNALSTFNPTPDAWAGEIAPAPTLAQATEAAHLIGIPGGMFSIFGY